MVIGIDTKEVIAATPRRADRRPILAACSFALGLALATAALALWVMSVVGHDDGRDVAVLLIVSLAAFGVGAHLMDCIECRPHD